MNAAEPVTRRPKAWEALAAQLILRFLRISERLSRDQSKTWGACWARVDFPPGEFDEEEAVTIFTVQFVRRGFVRNGQ